LSDVLVMTGVRCAMPRSRSAAARISEMSKAGARIVADYRKPALHPSTLGRLDRFETVGADN
jgi:hypothetical protein